MDLLNKDKIKNIASIGFFDNYPIEEYFIEGNSTIIFGTSDHLWAHLISSDEVELLSLLKKYHTKTKYFYSVEEWMIPLILKFGNEDWRMETNRYILHEKMEYTPINEEFNTLTKNDAEYMYSHSDYKEFTSIEYINDRMEKDISAGIIRDEKLAAWGFTHDDGALGFLHVLPEYRKQGLGEKITIQLIKLKLAARKPIFCNIVPHNIASINLSQKLGFEFDRKVYWLKLK